MTPAGGYTVRELGWDMAGRLPTATPVATHATYEAAHADATRRDTETWSRPRFNPFAYAGALFYLSSLPADQLRDWLLDHGIDPPGGHAWADWYTAARPDPVLLREALDKLRFFDVVPAWGVAYLVAEGIYSVNLWGGSPDYGLMTGQPLRAFAIASYAAKHGERLNHKLRRDGRKYQRVVTDHAVVEVPLAEPPTAGRSAYLVQRQALDAAGLLVQNTMYDRNENVIGYNDIGARVPLAFHAPHASAARYAADLHAAARRTMNPFARLGEPTDVVGFADALHGTGVSFAYPSPLTYFCSWAAWYDAEQAGLTDADRAAVWDLFTDRPLYEVVEMKWAAGPA